MKAIFRNVVEGILLPIILLTTFYGHSLKAATFDVTVPGGDEWSAPIPGTLKWAITQANTAGPGPHTITFSKFHKSTRSISSSSIRMLPT